MGFYTHRIEQDFWSGSPVHARPLPGGQIHYSAQPQSLASLLDWMNLDGALLARTGSIVPKPATSARSLVVEPRT